MGCFWPAGQGLLALLLGCTSPKRGQRLALQGGRSRIRTGMAWYLEKKQWGSLTLAQELVGVSYPPGSPLWYLQAGLWLFLCAPITPCATVVLKWTLWHWNGLRVYLPPHQTMKSLMARTMFCLQMTLGLAQGIDDGEPWVRRSWIIDLGDKGLGGFCTTSSPEETSE